MDIFKKIGQKELTKQGLQELALFKQRNPHVDLEPFLAQSSQYFRYTIVMTTLIPCCHIGFLISDLFENMLISRLW